MHEARVLGTNSEVWGYTGGGHRMELGAKPHEEDCEASSPPRDSLPWEA